MGVLEMKANRYIDFETETRYAFHTTINGKDYPQVHDFYELMLILYGDMNLMLDEKNEFHLREGDLFLIRPYEVHSKRTDSQCHYINLSFPQKTVDELFEYLDENDVKNLLLQTERLLPVSLSMHDKEILEHRLVALNTIPRQEAKAKKRSLRLLLIDVIAQYYISNIPWKDTSRDMPSWLVRTIAELNKKENFTMGTDFIYAGNQLSKEHICRYFRKYLKQSPSQYVNHLRLNYAANLLVHSDQQVLDICFESGFNNLGYFYRLFKEKYHVLPVEYRKKHKNIQEH